MAIVAAPCLKPACQLRLIALAPACMRFRNTNNLHVPNYRQMGSEKTSCTRACIALVGAGKESCYVATFIEACLLRFCSLTSSQTMIRHAHAHAHTHTYAHTHTTHTHTYTKTLTPVKHVLSSVEGWLKSMLGRGTHLSRQMTE